MATFTDQEIESAQQELRSRRDAILQLDRETIVPYVRRLAQLDIVNPPGRAPGANAADHFRTIVDNTWLHRFHHAPPEDHLWLQTLKDAVDGWLVGDCLQDLGRHQQRSGVVPQPERGPGEITDLVAQLSWHVHDRFRIATYGVAPSKWVCVRAGVVDAAGASFGSEVEQNVENTFAREEGLGWLQGWPTLCWHRIPPHTLPIQSELYEQLDQQRAHTSPPARLESAGSPPITLAPPTPNVPW
jgi:hypothetical protein